MSFKLAELFAEKKYRIDGERGGQTFERGMLQVVNHDISLRSSFTCNHFPVF